jgi:hypothetical protein
MEGVGGQPIDRVRRNPDDASAPQGAKRHLDGFIGRRIAERGQHRHPVNLPGTDASETSRALDSDQRP